MNVARLRRIDGTSAGADVRIIAAAAAAEAEAAPSARPRPRQSTNGSASSAARARADATPANLTSAIAEMEWSNEVGQTVEVKGDWWLGRWDLGPTSKLPSCSGRRVQCRCCCVEPFVSHGKLRILSQHRTDSFTAYSRTQVGACRPFAPAREPPHYEIYTCERRDERSDDNRDSKSGS